MLRLAASSAGGGHGGAVELAGSLTRQTELVNIALAGPTSHIANVGRAVEDMEIKLRNLIAEVSLSSEPYSTRAQTDSLLQVYFGKTKDILNDVRSFGGLERKRNEDALRRELVSLSLPEADWRG